MKIFKELKKLGYKHYAECTIEELDDLPLNSEERIMEQALVLRWFREKHKLNVSQDRDGGWWLFHIKDTSNEKEEGSVEVEGSYIHKEKHEEAELECLKKLIEIVKAKNETT